MRYCQFFTVALLLGVAGCGKGTAPVSGRVTLDNKPLVNATVIFMPDSTAKNPGPGSRGKTDANGQFSLDLLTGEGKGAIPGKHVVSITSYDGDDVVPSSGSDMKVFRKAIVPPRYNVKTELRFDVPAAGSKSADFDLKSDPDAK
jgi:hypothetical protein